MGFGELIGHGTGASWEKEKGNKKMMICNRMVYYSRKHFFFLNLSVLLLTSEVARRFKPGEVKGRCHGASCDLSHAVHGIHESQFVFLTVVESFL